MISEVKERIEKYVECDWSETQLLATKLQDLCV